MKRFLAALVLLSVLTVVPGARPSSADVVPANPQTCAGYPEPRVFLESQSWWYDSRAQSDAQASHVHSGACFPIFRTVSGVLHLDVVSKIHNEPVGTMLSAVRVQTAVNGTGAVTEVSRSPRTKCNTSDCTFINAVDVNLATIGGGNRAGLVEFRLHSETTRPDGAKNLATTGWYVYVEGSGAKKTSTAVRAPGIEARGWYETAQGAEHGYENADFLSPMPWAPVCGTWPVRIETKAGSGGSTPDRTLVTIDPNLHAVPAIPGTVLYDGAGAGRRTFQINTSTLANGPHKLVIAGAKNVGTDQRLAGVQVIPFTVDNTQPCPVRPDVALLLGPGMKVSGDPGSTTDMLIDAFTPPGTTKVEYYIDGVRFASDSSTPDFDEYFDPNRYKDGSHTLVAKATVGGVIRSSPPVQIVIGNT